IHQRGGDVLIDPNGMVRLHHIGKGPADRPRVEDILRLVP
ncbi:MAG TPA: SelL-related redox protein, partial [Desulfurivibrionaceae bacterium]|nr:SelL-related redox protein [Desulfurivibrionaceae bacterium]